MADQPNRLLDTNEQILILTQIGWELDAEVQEQNNQMSAIRDKVRRAATVVPNIMKSVGDKADGLIERGVLLEQKAVNIFEAANARLTVEVEKGLDEIEGDLNLLDNGGPPLGGSAT